MHESNLTSDDTVGEDAALRNETRGLSSAALLQGARAAHAEESATAGETTVARVRLGRWLAAIKDREAFLSEDCASVEEWAEKTLGIKRAMTSRYVSIARLAPTQFRGYDLSVAKLASLARCPAPLRPGLIPIAARAIDSNVTSVVKAARTAFRKSQNVDDALAVAIQTLERVSAGRARRSRQGRTTPKGSLPPQAALRQVNEALASLVDGGGLGSGADSVRQDACRAELQRTQELLARLGAHLKISTTVENSTVAVENSTAQSLDAAADEATPGAPEALVIPDAATRDLMKALRTGLDKKEDDQFCGALLELLLSPYPALVARCWRIIIDVVRKAASAERVPWLELHDWLYRVTSEDKAIFWPTVWNSFMCCPDRDGFNESLFAVVNTWFLPDAYAAQVRAASNMYPPHEDLWLEAFDYRCEDLLKSSRGDAPTDDLTDDE